MLTYQLPPVVDVSVWINMVLKCFHVCACVLLACFRSDARHYLESVTKQIIGQAHHL